MLPVFKRLVSVKHLLQRVERVCYPLKGGVKITPQYQYVSLYAVKLVSNSFCKKLGMKLDSVHSISVQPHMKLDSWV